jgi:diacylglycerol kinase
MKKLINSFKHAIDGVINTTRVEKNLQLHFIIMICVIVLGLKVELSSFEWIICLILFGLVISAEMFNTSFEKTLDYMTKDHDKKIKFIKDASAGAVLVLAITSAVIGLIIFVPKIF